MTFDRGVIAGIVLLVLTAAVLLGCLVAWWLRDRAEQRAFTAHAGPPAPRPRHAALVPAVAHEEYRWPGQPGNNMGQRAGLAGREKASPPHVATARERYHEEAGYGAGFFAAPTALTYRAGHPDVPPLDYSTAEADLAHRQEKHFPTDVPGQDDAGPESEPQQATVPAPAAPDAFSAAYAAVRAIQELSTDEYAKRLARPWADKTGSFAAIVEVA